MAIPDKWALQQVFNLSIFNLSTGHGIALLEDCKQSTLEAAGELVYSQGGKGNPKIIGFGHSKSAKFTTTSATVTNTMLATQLGTTPVIGVNTDLIWTEVCTVATNALTLSFTPIGTAGSQIKAIFVKNDDGSLGTKLTQDTVASTGKFSLASKTISLKAGDYANGIEFVVYYHVTTAATAVTISSYSDLFAPNVKVVADSLVRDICTGVDYCAQIIFYKAAMSNNFTIEASADGDPIIQSVEFEALKECGNTKMWDLIIFDSTTLT